jgi:diacylglycerol kinase
MKKRLLSFKFAFQGIRHMFREEPNARIHLVAAIIVVAAGIILKLTVTEWIMIIFAIGFVFSAELFNSAVEGFVDHVSPEYHKQAGKVKDLAAGAVLVAAITAAVIGLVVFVPKIVELLPWIAMDCHILPNIAIHCHLYN